MVTTNAATKSGYSVERHGILLQAGTNEVEFLLLSIGRQRYGINVSKICQILLFDRSKLALLPNQPPDILGVITFRDKTISVVDLRIHLRSDPPVQDNPKELLLVTEFNQRTTGFIVDQVDRIQRCSWNDFEPITETSCDRNTASVLGTVTLPDGIIVLLDLETIMSKLDPTMHMEHYQENIGKSTIERKNVSILYCEDSIVIQKILLNTLAKAGFENFHTFSSAQDGYAYLEKAAPGSIDIILSDIEMPQMDGLTFCKKVRNLETHGKLPFVFFSSMVNDQMELKCKTVGADACFSKPQIHLLVEAMERLLSDRS